MKQEKKQSEQAYWIQRNVASEKQVNDGAKVLERKVVTAYRQAQIYLTKEVRKLFTRLRQRTELSELEAKRLLNETVQPAELVALRKLADQVTDAKLQQAAKQRLTGLAFKERITRIEDLKAKSFLVSKKVADVQLDTSTTFYTDTIHDSYKTAVAETYIRKMSQQGITFEIWNKQTSVRNEHIFKELSIQQTKTILNSRWMGSNYSERIWKDTETLAKRLEELFTIESMTGLSEFEMARLISKEFNRSIGVARRLIRTEANYMANQAKLAAWQDRGIKEYMIVAVLDLRTSMICQNKDHKIYLVSEAIVNGKEGTYPPFHPFCRSIAVAYFGKRSLTGNRIANDPISGKTMTVSQRNTYDDWMQQLKELYSKDEIKNQKRKERKK